MTTIVGYYDSARYPAAFTPGNGSASEWYHKYIRTDKCPFCSYTLARETKYGSILGEFKELRDMMGGMRPQIKPPHLRNCNNDECGWWMLGSTFDYWSGEYSIDVIIVGQAKVFNIASKDAPIRALRKEIIKNPKLMHQTHHKSFELIIADCLKDKYPGSIITHVGKVGDKGIDIFCLIEDEPVLVQVKRRVKENYIEGVETIRILNGVLFREGIFQGIVVSTASKFSKAAKEETNIKTDTSTPYKVDLIDFNGILELLKNRNNRIDEPWKQYLICDKR